MTSNVGDNEIPRVDAELGAVRGDVAKIAEFVKDESTENTANNKDIYKTLERRATANKQQTIAIIGILVPLVIVVAGVLWSAIAANGEELRRQNEAEKELQYNLGFAASERIAAEKRADALSQRTENLEKLMIQHFSREK